MKKQKAINEFREYCLSLCVFDNNYTDFISKLEAIERNIAAIQDYIPLVNKKADDIMKEYGLSSDDVQSDFREIVTEAFRRGLSPE